MSAEEQTHIPSMKLIAWSVHCYSPAKPSASVDNFVFYLFSPPLEAFSKHALFLVIWNFTIMLLKSYSPPLHPFKVLGRVRAISMWRFLSLCYGQFSCKNSFIIFFCLFCVSLTYTSESQDSWLAFMFRFSKRSFQMLFSCLFIHFSTWAPWNLIFHLFNEPFISIIVLFKKLLFYILLFSSTLFLFQVCDAS